MDPLFEQFNKAKEGIHLSSDRKEAIRDNLVRLIEADLDIKKKPMPRYARGFGNFLKMPVMAALMIMILLGGGTSLAAERALPGDVLYPIKVVINEPVVSALSLSVEAKIDWEAELAGRRLKEAVELADAGKLNAEVEEKLSEEFTKHETKVRERIANLEEKGDEKVAASLAARFEGSLKAHEEALQHTEDSSANQDTALTVNTDMAPPEIMMISAKIIPVGEIEQSLKTKILSVLSTTADTRMRLEAKIQPDNGSSTERAVAKKIKSVSEDIERSEHLVKRKDRSNRSTKAEIKASRDLVREAKIKTEKKLFGEAFNLMNQAALSVEKSKAAAEISKETRNGSQEIDEENNNTSTATPTVTSTIKIETSSSSKMETEIEDLFENNSSRERR
ncbi:MAG: DUF5667 domain-containing protein [Patescibacteria group bacterium]